MNRLRSDRLLTGLPEDRWQIIQTQRLSLPASYDLDGDPRVTAVVLTYNRKAEVLRTLDRLTTLPERPQLIVVDNGSSDWTAEAATAAFPQVRVIRLRCNVGAAARNAGIELSTTPYVALCDDDTWWEAGSLTAACRLLDRYPRLAVVTGSVLVGSRHQMDPASRVMGASLLPPRPGCPGIPILGFLAGASVIRRAAFRDIGGFEPRYFIGGEEDLVALDLVSRGWHLAFIPDLIVHHYPSVKREPSRRGHLLLRNAVWTTWLRRPLPSAIRSTLYLLGSSLPYDGRRGVLREIVRGLPWVLTERSVIRPEIEALLRRLEDHH
jgi:GT2 family glycosyltransferase